MRPKRKRNRKDEQAPEAQPTETQSGQPRLTRLLDFPASALGTGCQMEISGNREVVIDGCQGVLEYDETVIKLATGKMSIKFTGRDLQIRVLTHSSAVVEGFITGIEFIT